LFFEIVADRKRKAEGTRQRAEYGKQVGAFVFSAFCLLPSALRPLHTAHYLLLTHLSFSVDKLKSANKIARIKKRKTIFDSFQLFISK
jgi:hypothetical protein